jgi:predicted CoA-binding protein
LDISYANKIISEAHDTKFLGLHIDNTLSLKKHTEQVLHTLSAACYAIRPVKPYVSQEILKMVYYAYFHSPVSYRIIFWGNFT